MEWVWLCVVNCSKIEILIKIDEQNTLHYQFFLSKMSQFTPFSRVNWKIWYSCLCKTFDKFHVCVFVFALSTCLMEGGQGSANSYPGSSITCSCQKCFNCKEKTISTYQVFIGLDPGFIITYWFVKLAITSCFVTDWYWAFEYGDNL